MHSQQQQHQLEPFARIERVGCDISVGYSGAGTERRLRICVTRKGRLVSCDTAPRCGDLRLADVDARIRDGRFGPTSGVYAALVRLAKVAEDFYGEVSQ